MSSGSSITIKQTNNSNLHEEKKTEDALLISDYDRLVDLFIKEQLLEQQRSQWNIAK